MDLITLQATYPSAASALFSMRTGVPASVAPPKEAIEQELSQLNALAAQLDQLADALIEGASDPQRELARISQVAYQHLGVSDAVRVFMGRLWAAAGRDWTDLAWRDFLLVTVDARHHAFSTLDFAEHLFTYRTFPTDVLLPWIKLACGHVHGDLLPHAFWRSVRSLCSQAPSTAIALAMHWLDEEPSEPYISTIAAVTGWTRDTVTHDTRSEHHTLEMRLRTSDKPSWRATYLRSWIEAAELGRLSLEDARALFDTLVTPNGDEEAAWCCLLHAFSRGTHLSADDQHRLYKELLNVSRRGMESAAQHWIVVTALGGIKASHTSSSVISTEDWLILLQGVCPIAAAHRGTWTAVTFALIEFLESAPDTSRAVVELLATHSGREWLAHDESELHWLFGEMKRHGQHVSLASHLCFSPGVYCRRLGMLIFDVTQADALDAEAVSAASPEQLELLLCESQRYHEIGPPSLARLHASLAPVVAQEFERILGRCKALHVGEKWLDISNQLLTEGMPAAFYDEVARQCRNTHAYRVALQNAATGDDYLMAILDDAHDRLRETRDSVGSPALRLTVPGYARAERLLARHLARTVAKGVEERSVLLKLVSKLSILYSNERYQRDGTLSSSSPLAVHSADVEVPQLDAADPEGAQLHRMGAAVRIAQLEPKSADIEDA